MFILAVVFAIIIGFLLGGNIKNLENVNIKGTYLIIISFVIEFITVMGIKYSIFQAGYITFLLDIIMYLVILIFIVINRKSLSIVIMGLGFGFNAIAIFLNGGAMPVSKAAMEHLGLTGDITREGLYTVINEGTRMAFLGDIIPIKFISTFIVSIGDIIAALGLVLIIVLGMKKKK